MLGERLVDADHQRGTLVHACMQMLEDIALQGVHEVGEYEVAAQNQVEGARRECPSDIAMGEVNAPAKLPAQVVLAVHQLECAAPPGLGQILEAARLETTAASAIEHPGV